MQGYSEASLSGLFARQTTTAESEVDSHSLSLSESSSLTLKQLGASTKSEQGSPATIADATLTTTPSRCFSAYLGFPDAATIG